MEPEEGKVSVWVCREEKLVSGLTKRTTCADVVRVLLEDQNLQQGVSASMLSGAPQSYCVVEKWRGFERILPNKTKILRLWSAWGDEQENVRFVLVKNEASLPNNGPRSAEARVVQSRESSGGPGGLLKGTARTCWTAAAAAANTSQEKQRRIVRKAFRKLDKMNKKKEQAVFKDKGSVEKMETLVHLVISQDHTIRQQIQRVKELDREIERYEAKVHFDRIKRHGVNYVQDTYMVEPPSDAPNSSDCKRKAERQDTEALAQFEEYARRCEEVVRLQEELTEREALVESITGEIQEELNRRWMKRRREERAADAAAQEADGAAEETCLAASAAPAVEPDAESLSENELALEEERIKTQLDTSLYIGLRLKTDLDAMRGDLDLSLALWETRESELLDLLAKVETMEIEHANKKLSDDGQGEQGEQGAVSSEAEPEAGEKSGGWVEQARGLSKTCNTNDEDSDTGLSSMHSQDSDNPPVCESLV
ncbi:ras association domain-containing protein 10 [Embiotoca jacksoni]|uniref:ras association domain-containing protein 10 n=1 Tax=Embiotoca jacksoni TaxID=100190 RepID=UPI003704396E